MKAAKFYILLFLGWQTVLAQVFPTLKFSHITTKEGLSNNHVKWLTQDKKGFIWVGTEDGLNRLDGYRIKTFFHHPGDSNSLVNNEINEIVGDDKNNLWVTTQEGISYYNTSQNKFINFLHKEGDSTSLRSDRAKSVYLENKNRQTWFSLHNSLYKFDENLRYMDFPVNTSKLPAGFSGFPVLYWGIYEDHQHQLWTYCHNWIFKLNPETKEITESFNTGVGDVYSFIQDQNNNYWVGTWGGGLLNFNPRTNGLKKITLSNSPNIIFSICEWKDKNNNNWIVMGSERGLILLDPVTLNNQSFLNEPLNDRSISAGDNLNLFVDSENILWIGTDDGVSYVEPSKQLIEAWPIEDAGYKIKGYKAGYSHCFFEDNNTYWSSNKIKPELMQFDSEGHLIKSIANLYSRNPEILKPGTDRAFSIIKQPDSSFWCSTEMGLVHLNFVKNKSDLYTTPDGNNNPGFRTILQYSDSIWWIRTRNNGANGIYVFNCIEKKFMQHYFHTPGNNNSLPSYLQDFIITKDKNIYAAPSDNYLYQFNQQQNNFIPLFTSKEQTRLMPSKTFDCIAEDSSGNLWIGTGNGLFQLDPVNKKILEDYSTDKKIGGISISKLCFDDEQNLWMTTERGLFCLTHRTKEIFNFNTGDGLPSNSIPGFLTKGANSFMYAGVLGYIVKFKPAELLHKHVSGDVEFSEVTVMNLPYTVKQNENKKKEISLDAGQNIFSVDFSVLNYDNAAGNRYYYMLDGIMKDWKENENGHLSFYNLPPGDYILHVKGGDKYGEKFKNEALLIIEVVPYWWQTKWFYALLILLAGAIIYMLMRKRIKNIRHEAEMKHKIAEAEMMALKAQMNPHFIFNCINSIDGLIQSNDKYNATNYLNKFAKLIRNVLDSSKENNILFSKDIETLQLYVDLEKLRSENKFSAQINVSKELLNSDYKVPPLIIQPFVENAIHHGLRNKEGNTGELHVLAERVEDNIQYTITDNGIGRQAAAKINTHQHQSYGMQMSFDRIKMFNDEDTAAVKIDDLYENNIAAGTKVQVNLKIK